MIKTTDDVLTDEEDCVVMPAVPWSSWPGKGGAIIGTQQTVGI